MGDFKVAFGHGHPLVLLRKRRGGGEKLGGVGFLEVSAFLFEGVGERGLGFIYSFLLLLCFVNVLLFFKTFEGERGDFYFFIFLKEILKGVGLGFFFFTFCYSFII